MKRQMFQFPIIYKSELTDKWMDTKKSLKKVKTFHQGFLLIIR